MMKLTLAFACLMVLSCGNGAVSRTAIQPSPTPAVNIAQSTAVAASPVLLEISFDGGLVPDSTGYGHIGHSEFVVTREGAYSYSGDVARKTKGVLLKSDLDALAHEINNADFVALRSEKFTGQCPRGTDGDELTYTFYTQKSVEVIASCKVAIDYKSPLFIKVWELLKKTREQ